MEVDSERTHRVEDEEKHTLNLKDFNHKFIGKRAIPKSSTEMGFLIAVSRQLHRKRKNHSGNNARRWTRQEHTTERIKRNV